MIMIYDYKNLLTVFKIKKFILLFFYQTKFLSISITVK